MTAKEKRSEQSKSQNQSLHKRLSLRLQEARNSIVHDLYDSCENLPQIRFDKICNTSDYRLLVKADKPLVYNQKRLLKTWDKITEEYDRLSKKYLFQRSYDDSAELLKEHNRLQGIQSALILMRMNQPESVDMLKYWGIHVTEISIEAIRQVKQQLMSEQTRLNIQYLEEQKYTELEVQAKQSIIRAMIQAENILGRSLGDKSIITVEEWLGITEECDRIIASTKKKGKQYGNPDI